MKKFSFEDISEVLFNIPQNIKQKKVSILVPYYNEENIIVKNIHTIIKKMTEWDWDFEIIISDDGSNDQGYTKLQQEFTQYSFIKLIRSPRNYGKGRALATAFEESVGDYILFLDSDLELPLEHLPYFMNKMIETKVDIVIGSKEDKASDLDYPIIRKIFSLGYSLINKTLFNLSVKDTQTGIKLFKREALENTLPYLLVKRFAFDIELLVLAQYKGFTIQSHPIVLQYTREETVGRMSLDTILHMAKDTLAVFWRLKSKFWDDLVIGKATLKYAILSFEEKDKQSTDTFYIKDLTEISSVLLQLQSYHVIIFKDKQEEIPVFAKHTLDRIFADDTIQGVLPLLYPISSKIDEELYYVMMGNVFFPKGYYPRYRPVKQKLIKEFSIKKSYFLTQSFVYRREFLEKIIKENNNICPERITDLSSIVHTPFYFIHKQFPSTMAEFQYFLQNICKNIGIKKLVRDSYIFSMLLFLFAMIGQNYLFAIPLLLLELILQSWYIYSLGIRKGVKYLVLFNTMRIKYLGSKIFKIVKK